MTFYTDLADGLLSTRAAVMATEIEYLTPLTGQLLGSVLQDPRGLVTAGHGGQYTGAGEWFAERWNGQDFEYRRFATQAEAKAWIFAYDPNREVRR